MYFYDISLALAILHAFSKIEQNSVGIYYLNIIMNPECLSKIGGRDTGFKITSSAYLEILDGVAVATKTSEKEKNPVVLWISSRENLFEGILSKNLDTQTCSKSDHREKAADVLSFESWRLSIQSAFPDQDEQSRQLASLALAITFMREKCRFEQPVNGTDLGLVWDLIHGALTSPLLSRPLGHTNNSAKGMFLIIPLCSLVKAGYIDQLFRLHIWLPNGPRPIPDFAIHSHQCFAQSWILAGQGINHPCKLDTTTDASRATHAEYTTEWAHGKLYKTDTTKSTIWNTGDLVEVTELEEAVHTRDMTYTVPAGAFHRSEVPSDGFHSTLFFFDSRRGFVEDARILGPKGGGNYCHSREPATSHEGNPGDVTPRILTGLVEAVRSWEMFMWQGSRYSEANRLEEAEQAFGNALRLCEEVENFPNATRYKNLVLAELE